MQIVVLPTLTKSGGKMSSFQIPVSMTPEELATKVQSGEWTVNTNPGSPGSQQDARSAKSEDWVRPAS